MKAQNIHEGDRLTLTADAKERYGLAEDSLTVLHLHYKDRYKTPFVVCYYGDRIMGYFRPSDFKQSALEEEGKYGDHRDSITQSWLGP